MSTPPTGPQHLSSEQPTASSPNMKHVWGLICLPLMGCQNSGLRGQQGSHASPPSLHPAHLLYRSHWPATDMSNNFLSGCCLVQTQHTHTHSAKKHAHTLTVTGCLGMYKTWTCTCAHTHIFFLSPVLFLACLACSNLLQRRQRIFWAEPHPSSSTGLLCKHCYLPLISSSF